MVRVTHTQPSITAPIIQYVANSQTSNTIIRLRYNGITSTYNHGLHFAKYSEKYTQPITVNDRIIFFAMHPVAIKTIIAIG